MWRNMFGQIIYQLVLLLVLQFCGLQLLHLHDDKEIKMKSGVNTSEVLSTVIFNSFVFCQIFNEINARKPDSFNIFEGLLSNRIFLCVVFCTAGMQVLIIELCGSFASTVPLKWELWLVCVGLGALSLPLAALVKLISVPKTSFLEWMSHPKVLLFRNGGTIKATVIRSLSRTEGSDQYRSQSMKQSKFYKGLGVDPSALSPDGLPESQGCLHCILHALCPGSHGPSVKSDGENPNPRNGQVAWS